MKLTRLLLAALAAAALLPATGCWRKHCCESTYKPPCPAPAPAYYAPADGCQ
ncbi:MAG TPA: hypothetical protein VGJ05_15690 [Fimbriiglobus sp.]